MSKSIITVQKGMRGWFAVKMCYTPGENDQEGFWEPWDTGFGRYETKPEAVAEALQWAKDEELEVEV